MMRANDDDYETQYGKLRKRKEEEEHGKSRVAFHNNQNQMMAKMAKMSHVDDIV